MKSNNMINRQYAFNILYVFNHKTENNLSTYYSWIKEHHERVEGGFVQTMSAQIDQLKVLSATLLNREFYQSCMTALTFIWPRLFCGGITFLDKYFSLKLPVTHIAVDEFFEPFGNNVKLKCPKSEDTFERRIAIKLWR